MGAPSIRQFILSHQSTVIPEVEAPEISPTAEPEGSQGHLEAMSEYLDGIGPSHGADLLQRHGPPQRSQQAIAASVETSLRGIAASERLGDLRTRPYFYYAMQDLYQLIALSDGEVRERHTRDFIGVAERYMNFLDRFDLPDSERFHFLYPAMQFTQAALQAGAQAETTTPAHHLMQNLLRQLNQNLLGYYDAMTESGDPLAASLQGLVLDIQVREALLDGNYEASGQFASQLMVYRNTHPLPADPEPWFDRWELQLRLGNEADTSQVDEMLGDLQSPPRLPQANTVVAGLTFDLFARLAVGIDAANELAPETIARRFNLMTLLTSPLLVAQPDTPLEEILRQLTTESGQMRAAALFNMAMQSNPALREQWEQLFPDTSVDATLPEVGEIAASWLEYREGPARRLMPPLLRAQREFLGDPSQISGSVDQVLTEYGQGLLEIYQTLALDPEAHEVAALHSAAQYWSEREEIAPGQPMPQGLRQGAARILDRFSSWEFRASRILEPLISAEGLFIVGSGLVFGELFPALLIGRAGTAGRLGVLVEGGRLTLPGTLLNGFATGVFLSGLGSGVQNIIRARHGLSTHFWRDFGTGTIVNGATFMGAMAAGHGLQRWLRPNPNHARLLGRVPWGRHLAMRGGAAFAGGTVAWLGGIGMRGAMTGEWTTSVDEFAANYLNMVAFELGSMGFSALRRHAALRSELGQYRFGEGSFGRTVESGFSRLLVNRFYPVLGQHRRGQLDIFTRFMMMPDGNTTAGGQALQSGGRRGVVLFDPAWEIFPGERELLHRRLGMEEMLHPGSLQQIFRNGRHDGMVALGDTPPTEIAWSSQGRGPRELPALGSSEGEVAPPAPPARPPRPARQPGPREVRMMDGAEIQRRVAEAQAQQAEAQAEAAEPGTTAQQGGQTVFFTGPQAHEIQPGYSPFFGVEDNRPGEPRQAAFQFRLGNLGEISAFTEVGGREQNEDGIGIWYDRDGRAVMMVADGMGGHHAGDAASAEGIRGFFDFLVSQPHASLLEGFQAAHEGVLAIPPPSSGARQGRPGAAASAARVDIMGQTDIAQIGDTQIYVARWQPGDTYVIERIALPDNYAGRMRDINPDGTDTGQMHASPFASRIASFLGMHGEHLTPVQRVGEAGDGISPVVHRPNALRLNPNDILLLMSDGVHGQFLSQEFTGLMQGRTGIGEIAQIIRSETIYRQELFGMIPGIPAGERAPIQHGRLQGCFIDQAGHLYDQREGGRPVGAISVDNLSLIAYRHLGVRGP